jgi:hypothetical protein
MLLFLGRFHSNLDSYNPICLKSQYNNYTKSVQYIYIQFSNRIPVLDWAWIYPGMVNTLNKINQRSI